MRNQLLPSFTERHRPRRRALAAGRLLAGVLASTLAGSVQANPTGPTIVHGSAHFGHPGAGTLNVTTSPNAIINWQGFSIGADEVTRFIQPSASSAVLNRVGGADPSAILGQLLSNGRVFLVNPQGIVFGGDAVVDTAGLVASTLDISDADFLAGSYRFDAGPGAGEVVNQGLIKAGAGGVFLLAPSVENSGIIRTDGGDLLLAAGRRITLTSLDLEGVRVEVQAPEDAALNLGTLIAERGAAGVFAGSIRNAGTVEANAVTVDEDGTVRLVAQGDITLEANGRVAAEGPTGGTVHIESGSGTTWISGEVSARASEGSGGVIRLLGPRVGLAEARVDASGPAGGGKVLVGGDESGGGSVPTADSTYVSADSSVSADALASGDGGKVVVFAEGFANVRGRLSARGGPDGGNGGFVETSGRETFAILHTPDTTAPGGGGGHWLIDPNDIEIVAGGGNVNLPDTDPFVSTGDGAQLGIELLIAALSGGQSVTVRTSEAGANSEGGDITLNVPVDIEATTGTNTLTLDAHRDVIVNQSVSDAAGGAVLHLVLDADGEVFIDADVTLYDGSLRTDAVEVSVSNGANVVMDGVTWTINAEEASVGGYSLGVVTVRNGGAITANVDRIEVGASGDGRLVIESGADVTGAANVIIGQDEGTTGEVVVTGSGSTLAAEWIGVGYNGTGTLTIENGAGVAARWVGVGNNEGSDGTVTVTGSGSSLVTAGIDNSVVIGREGSGVFRVLDGGLVDTLFFEVARSGVGRALISGVAADGTRSRVIASPANGRFSGVWANEAGFARVAREAGANGVLEILDGGLLRVLDGEGTYGPEFEIARNRGSTGRVVIDGAGSSLEVIQNGPAVRGDPNVWPGPTAELGRRGEGTTVIRNGARLLVRGESAFVRISRDSVFSNFPDPDAGPIDQQSVVNIESGGRMEIDGENALLVVGDAGPAADGVVTVSGSGSMLIVNGADNALVVGDEGIGRLVIENGAEVTATHVIVGDDAGSEGSLEVRGPGSALITRGTANFVFIGDAGTGECRVLDGGLIDTLWFEVGYSGTGRAVISGVAADGTRSRVIASPANGRFSGVWANEAGFARVAREAGANGVLEILDGGLLRILDGDGTYGPEFQIARNKGSVGRLVIDGAGSSLEVIQNGPVVHGDPYVWPGPLAQLGRRGEGTTVIRNGGRLLVRGESVFVRISRDSVFSNSPDPDAGPIDQQSVVNIESGGRMEIDGENALLVVGDAGPAADGVVIVTGSGSMLSLAGAGNRIVVGDDEARGRLEVRDGGRAYYLRLVLGANGFTNLPEVGSAAVDDNAATNEILSTLPDDAAAVGEDSAADGEPQEEEDEEEEVAESTGEAGEETEEREALPACPA